MMNGTSGAPHAATFDAKADIAPNSILNNRYRVEHLISRGGMGAVYRAIDLTFGSTVAIKHVVTSDPALIRAFHREAQLLNTLRHAALPVVMDYFAGSDGEYLVMQFIDGEDFGSILKTQQRPFAVRDVVKWAVDLLNVLEYLHSRVPPVLHRDIKPQNLKLSPQGDIVLLDFGLAKGATSESTGLTESVFGYTRHYASIEQILGRPTDPRSDIYSLAATLYHLLTGVRPLDASERGSVLMTGKPDPLAPVHELNPSVTRAVSAVIYMAMAINADQRFPSAAAMRDALTIAAQSSLGGGETVVEVPVQSLEIARPLQEKTPPVPTPPVPTPRKPRRVLRFIAASFGYILAAVFAATSVGILIWGLETNRKLESSLDTANSGFSTERSRRTRTAERHPIDTLDISFRNENNQRSPLGPYSTQFKKSELKYIAGYFKLESNYIGLKKLDGPLYIRILQPNGTTMTGKDSPAGYTAQIDISLSETLDTSFSWGAMSGWTNDQAGSYQVQLWWDDKLVGWKSFTLVDDLYTSSTP